MIGFAILCALFVVGGAKAQGSWQALDAEQALFVYTRCHEDHLPSGPSRTQYISNWGQWKLEPNNAVTQCYVKCCLEGLGLYDADAKKFRAERISTQHEAFKSVNEATESEVAEYQQKVGALDVGGGSCEEVFNAYLPVHKKLNQVTRKLYHGTVEGAARVYAAFPTIKRKEQSYFAYCEARVYGDSNKDDLCKARQYELTGSDQLKDHIDCIFRGLRYLNQNGLNVDEIVRDFKQVNKANLESRVRSVLKECAGNTAYDYYSCLLNSDLKEDFKSAFDFREVRSANYGYLVQGKVYDAAKVRAEVAKADAKVC